MQLQEWQHYKQQLLSHALQFCITVQNRRGGYSEWREWRKLKYYAARTELSVEFTAWTVRNLRGCYTKVCWEVTLPYIRSMQFLTVSYPCDVCNVGLSYNRQCSIIHLQAWETHSELMAMGFDSLTSIMRAVAAASINNKGRNAFTKWVLWYFTCLVEHNNLLQIQIYCYKANHTRDITLHTARNYFHCNLLELRYIENMLHKFVYVNEIRISCHCMDYGVLYGVNFIKAQRISWFGLTSRMEAGRTFEEYMTGSYTP